MANPNPLRPCLGMRLAAALLSCAITASTLSIIVLGMTGEAAPVLLAPAAAAPAAG